MPEAASIQATPRPPEPGEAARPRRAAFGWPRLCEVCRSWATGAVCGDCQARYAVPRARCAACALPLPAGGTCGDCQRSPPPWSACIAALDYAFPWDRLITQLKFGSRPDLAAPLADRLADLVTARIGAGPEGPDAVRGTIVTAVPLGPRRLAERGFNQSWLVARRLAAHCGLKADPGLLMRCRDTPPQSGLDRRAREANLRAALLATPGREAAIAGRAVALVDDVMTTGATAAAAAAALTAAGATSVAIWVVARTDDPRQR